MDKVVPETTVRKKRFGRCRICQKFTQMTKEHVPPKSAFHKEVFFNRTAGKASLKL